MGTRDIELTVMTDFGGKVFSVSKQNTIVKKGDIVKLDAKTRDLYINQIELAYVHVDFSMRMSGLRKGPETQITIKLLAPEQKLQNGKYVYVDTGEGNGEVTFKLPVPEVPDVNLDEGISFGEQAGYELVVNLGPSAVYKLPSNHKKLGLRQVISIYGIPAQIIGASYATDGKYTISVRPYPHETGNLTRSQAFDNFYRKVTAARAKYLSVQPDLT